MSKKQSPQSVPALDELQRLGQEFEAAPDAPLSQGEADLWLRANKIIAGLIAERDKLVERVSVLTEALQGLVDGVVPEVNEKGAGGYLLARLADAKDALTRTSEVKHD